MTTPNAKKQIKSQPAIEGAIEKIHQDTQAQVSLAFAENTSLSQWRETGKTIIRGMSLTGFFLGDWLLFGEKHFDKSAYEEAEKATGLKIQTLRNMKAVAKAFLPEQRDPALSFEHHRLLQSVFGKEDKTDFEKIVARVKDEDLSANAMKETDEYRAATAKAVVELTPDQLESKLAKEKADKEINDAVEARGHVDKFLAYVNAGIPADRLAGWLEHLENITNWVNKNAEDLITGAREKRAAILPK